MKGLWILPSRRRIGKLSVFFEKAMENGITTPGAVLVQQDELIELKSLYDGIKKPNNWQILPTKSDGMGDKYREIWPAVQNMDWIGIGCDDLRPQTKEWDRILLKHLDGKNVVSCNDGQQGNLRMSGITIFSGALLRTIGYIYPSNLWHTYLDNIWEDLGRTTGCWTYVPEVLVTHDHPFVNQRIDPKKADETTLKSYGQMEKDYQVFNMWNATERPKVIERIQKLRNGTA